MSDTAYRRFIRVYIRDWTLIRPALFAQSRCVTDRPVDKHHAAGLSVAVCTTSLDAAINTTLLQSTH